MVRSEEAFQRMQLEVYWRKIESAFFPPLTSLPFKKIDECDDGHLYSSSLCADTACCLLEEYQRLGVGKTTYKRTPNKFQSKWRISDANEKYQLCPSYPQKLVVPSAISDAHLSISCKQRSAQRIPALTWIHPENGAALCRSAHVKKKLLTTRGYMFIVIGQVNRLLGL